MEEDVLVMIIIVGAVCLVLITVTIALTYEDAIETPLESCMEACSNLFDSDNRYESKKSMSTCHGQCITHLSTGGAACWASTSDI